MLAYLFTLFFFHFDVIKIKLPSKYVSFNWQMKFKTSLSQAVSLKKF